MILISGGEFQDSEGNPLANGTLMLKLSWDSTETVTTPNGTVYAGPRIKIALDATGNCPSTAIWSNAELAVSTYYSVNLFDVNGVPVLEAPLTWVFGQTQTKASGILLGTCKGTDGDTITIGSTVYTLKNTLTAAYQVKIGATTAADTIANLVAAINGTAGAGTIYGTGTVANTQVTAALSGSNIIVTAILPGVAGNAITISASSTCFGWSQIAATGTLIASCPGANNDTITIGTETYTLKTVLTGAAGEILIGATAAITAFNLMSAINGAAGAGIIYGTGTTASTQVTAVLNGTIITLTAIVAGSSGNSIATTSTSLCFAFTASTLTGGGTATTLSGGGVDTTVDLGTVINVTVNNGTTYIPVPGAQGIQGIAGPPGVAVGSAFGSFEYIIDGGGSVPGTGLRGTIQIPTNCTITGWSLIADAAGSAVIDVLKSNFATFPSNASICGSDKPTLASSIKQANLTPVAWSTSLAQGDVVQFNLVSVTTCLRLCLTIFCSIP